ncbi:MAG: hypothetical protein AB7P76_05170 [Candidatus Melainabacteria bacterium]
MKNHWRQLSLRDRAAMFTRLLQEPGWQLLQENFRPEIRTSITDTDAREAFIYEATRAQVLQELFATPQLIIQQADREWHRHPPMPAPSPEPPSPQSPDNAPGKPDR